ncbi:SIMPL domain-containing protein [Paractinoplanes rishiriensis]|uniref:SIMPL domain-containing protein n=1 Tax=Paractinoplanes rishiriensis TaxID=1050105 RepID=A0A919K9E3_9ACTN|nr:SIMPL domain-containing protein [Actinoplanes rishiriensis]GIE99011.1 hypothetical protein Ari01nite_64760 [Actinoplanes rishiriensis]
MPEQPMVVVRGEAVREVPPEIASFTVTATVRDRDKETVLTRLAERAAGVRLALDGYGETIERRETGGVEVYPEVKRERKTVGYVGRVATTVTVTDFAALGEMLLRLAALDDVAVAGPWWQLRVGSTAGADVRRAAIADALARAREYAEAVGSRVERLVEIADEGAGGASPVMFRAGAAEMAYDTAGGLDLDPQQQTVRASVVVRVAITEPDLTG